MKKLTKRIGTLLLVFAMMLGTSISVLASTADNAIGVEDSYYEVAPAEAGNTQVDTIVKPGKSGSYTFYLSNNARIDKTFYFGLTPSTPIHTGNVIVRLYAPNGTQIMRWDFEGTQIDSWNETHFSTPITGNYKVSVYNGTDVDLYFCCTWGAN